MFNIFKKKKKEVITLKVQPVENFTNIDNFIKYFREDTGIDFSNKKEIVKNKLIIFCRSHNIHNFDECLAKVKNNESIKQELIDTFAVNETYFFRELKQIQEVIKKAKNIKSKIEILCAPSSSGEEPYSIAILLLEEGFSADTFHIVGIDISDKVITKAREAIYSKRSLHRVDQSLINKYFTLTEDKYILKDIVKRQVSFRRVNIFDVGFNNLRKFDYIFSRNMMIYFDDETKKRAKSILQKLLKDPQEPILFGHADMSH
ncbi:MAG: CheR family methyltransferase [Sulfurospirillaceae bacterium]|nr:CheR family methyltransferase [Sulfurospirillaceae bacterium]